MTRKLQDSRKGTLASLMAKMASEFDHRVQTAEEASKSWRYLDFVDPKTGLPAIAHEWLIGASGFRAGTVNQFRALFAKGKSSLCMLEYGSSMRNGGAWCAHIETEGAGMSASRIAQFGTDPSNLAVPEGVDSFEDCVEFIDTFRCLIRGGDGGSINELGRKSATKFKKEDAEDPGCEKPILIGVDSLSALGKDDNTKIDVADMTKTNQISWLTVKIREWMRQKALVYQRDQVTLFLTSHETQQIAIGPMAAFTGPKKTSVAGNAIGMFDTTGIDFNTKDWKGRDGSLLGTEVILKTFKNKLNAPGHQISLFLTKENGFDMIHADAEFLLGKDSPFADGKGIFDGTRLCYRHAGGITCRPLGDKAFKSEEEFVRAFYDNKDVLYTARNGMRIMGYGLPHEMKYKDQFDENGLWKGSGFAEGEEPQSHTSAESSDDTDDE